VQDDQELKCECIDEKAMSDIKFAVHRLRDDIERMKEEAEDEGDLIGEEIIKERLQEVNSLIDDMNRISTC
jgi:hypothetical protein